MYINNKLLSTIILILIGFLLFFTIIVYNKISLNANQLKIVKSLNFVLLDESGNRKFINLKDKVLLITFFDNFNFSCDLERINVLNRISEEIQKKEIKNIQNIAVFYNGYRIQDINNIKKIGNIKFKCAVTNYGSSLINKLIKRYSGGVNTVPLQLKFE